MKKKLYIITKDKYDGSKKVLGFFERRNNDLYYDIGSVSGSHNSYHKDGSEWRTSYNGKKTKISEHISLSSFQGFHPLGVVMFQKSLLPLFQEVKQKHINNTLLEIDFSRFPSDVINLVLEIIEPEKELQINEDTKFPDNAVHTIRKQLNPWIIFTILGHENNLLVIPNDNGFTVKHYNKRFTVNDKDGQYFSEASSKNIFI